VKKKRSRRKTPVGRRPQVPSKFGAEGPWGHRPAGTLLKELFNKVEFARTEGQKSDEFYTPASIVNGDELLDRICP
jgi:hypothetical protein